MSLRLKRYPARRDSGVPWLGALPVSWRILRGKNVFRVIDIRSQTGAEELLTVSAVYGVVPRRQTTVTMFKAESYVGHKLCWPGDLVINSLWAWMQGLGIARDHGLISSAYSVYRPRPAFTEYANYFHYAFRSAAYKWELLTRSKGVWLSRLQLSDSAFLDMPIILPPADELPAVVRFLDHADRGIRRYIRAKRRMIELLNEQKQAIIQKAVTRGLDPNVRLKPSGVDWLPEIPQHWSAIRLGSIAESLQTGPFGSQLHATEYLPNGVPVINPSHMNGGRVNPDPTCAVDPKKAAELCRHRLEAGDIIFARRGELGRCALVTQREQGWLCGTGSLRMRTRGDLADPEYLVRLLLSTGVAQWLSLQSVGSTMENLNPGILSRLPLPLPPRSEQGGILTHITKQRCALDDALQLVHREMDLVREYRTRLISDVVRGKLDVRGVELPPLEEAEELPTVGDEALDEAAEEETDLEPVDEGADSAD